MTATYETELAAAVAKAIVRVIPDALVEVDDPDGTHLAAVVKSAAFAGMTRVQQHKLVYAALGNAFETHLHALQLTTQVL